MFIPLVFVLSGIAVVYTSLVALVQRDMKKLIAYSSVAHMAFVTFGLFAMNRQGIEGAMMVMLGHGLVSGALFLCVGVIYDRLHTREIDALRRPYRQHARLCVAVHGLHHGQRRPAGHQQFRRRVPEPGRNLSGVELGGDCGTTGIILGAAYMLWLYWRICFGTQRNADAAAMPDLVGARMVAAGADRGGGSLDGRLSRELPAADAQRRWAAAGAARARRARGRFASDARQCRATAHGPRSDALMGRFAPFLPELILSIGAIALMMVAAFAGRRGSALTSWLAVALLIGATVALIGAPSHAGPVFGGLVTADLFARFGKAIIFPAAAVAIIAAHGWFERGTEHASEYAVLILFSAVGMSVMVSATSLISLYVGLELTSLASYVLAAYRRTDERSAEAGLKYFVLGALASGILLYGISLLYGFTGTIEFAGIAAAFGARSAVARPAVRPGVPARRPRLQDQRRAVPHVDAGRLRRRADAGHRFLRLGAEGCRGAAVDPRLHRGARARRPTHGARS